MCFIFWTIQKISQNLPPTLKQIIEELEQFQATYNVYKERGYEKSIPRAVSKVAIKLRKSLELFKNEAILNAISNKEDLSLQNFKENLKENLYNTTISLNEKSRLIKIIQKGKLSKNDKEELISLLNRIPPKETVLLGGKTFSQLYRQKSLLSFTGKKNPDGSVNLKWYAENLIDQFIKRAHSKAREKFAFETGIKAQNFVLTSSKWKNLEKVVSTKGKLKYAWVGFTYIFKSIDNNFYQAGLSTVPHPKRYNFYKYNIIYHPEKRLFKKTDTPTILGYIFKYLENKYGLEFFKNPDGTNNFDLVDEKIKEQFEFKIVGVFWDDHAMRNSETELILLGADPSKIANIEDLLEKYGLDSSLIGKGLNSINAAGIGGYDSLELFKRIIYYVSMGYSTITMYNLIKSVHLYRKSYITFKKLFYSIFESINNARQMFTIPLINILKKEGLTQNEINKLYPLLRKLQKKKLLKLIRGGYEEKEIVKKIGFKLTTFINKINEFIEEEIPHLIKYFKNFKKSNVPSFMDLKYLLLCSSIFQSAFKNLNRNQACEQFKIQISVSFLKNLCSRIFGCSYSNLKTECIALLSKETIKQYFFDTPLDFISFFLDKYSSISNAKSEFYKKAFIAYNLQKIYIISGEINSLKMNQLNNEKINKIIELSFKAIIGEVLLECYVNGLNSKEIAIEYKIFQSEKDVENWSKVLFNMKSQEILHALRNGTLNLNINLKKRFGINIPSEYKICKFCIERYETFPYIIED